MGVDTVFPITELSAYHSNWTIQARVTSKSELRTFTKGTNSGKVFSVDLLDAGGGEIRATFFQPAADKFYQMLEKGKCFTFSRGSTKVADRKYNSCNHRYELVFAEKAVIEEAKDDAAILAIKISPTDLRTVQTKPVPCTVDICAVVVDFKPVVAFTSKDGKELVKRDITVADDSAMSIRVTLWGDRARAEDSIFEGNPVISIKSVIIKEWQDGRQASLLQSGALVFGTESPEAQKIQEWWKAGGSSQTLTSLSQYSGSGGARKGTPADLAEIRRATERVTDQPELFTAVCRLALVQMRKQGETQPLYYDACQEPKEGNGLPCNRRVDESGFCATCNRAGRVAQRFNLRCKYADSADSLWMTTFHEGAEKVAGMAAHEARAIERGDAGREALETAVQEQYFSKPLQITVRAKLDSYQGQSRPNISCVDARPVVYADHGRAMLKEIMTMTGNA